MLTWRTSYHSRCRELGIGSMFYGVMWISTRFISNPIWACFQGLILKIYKYARQTCSGVEIVTNICWFLRWQLDSLGVEDGRGPYMIILGQQAQPLCVYITVLSTEGTKKGTFDMVLHRLGVSASRWKKQFFRDSIDVHMSWAEVKINKLMKSNIERVTKLTEHTPFLFFSLVPQNAPSCIWTQDVR